MNIREAVLDQLDMLSHASKQLEYERSLTVAGHAPTELISIFCDDLYRPKSAAFNEAFSSDELKDLAHLYGLLVEASATSFSTVAEMLKDSTWRRVMEVAKGMAARFKSTA